MLFLLAPAPFRFRATFVGILATCNLFAFQALARFDFVPHADERSCDTLVRRRELLERGHGPRVIARGEQLFRQVDNRLRAAFLFGTPIGLAKPDA